MEVDRQEDGFHRLHRHAHQAQDVNGQHVPTEAHHLTKPRQSQSYVHHAHQLRKTAGEQRRTRGGGGGVVVGVEEGSQNRTTQATRWMKKNA